MCAPGFFFRKRATMSIYDLKMRMAEVAGIEVLTMGVEAGGIVLRWGDDYSATVDASAFDADCELAVRRSAAAGAIPRAAPQLGRFLAERMNETIIPRVGTTVDIAAQIIRLSL
jgi:hypothetical protein